MTFIRQIIPGRSVAEQQSCKRPDESCGGTPGPAVAQLAISRNTADIACVVHLAEGEQSRLELRSVNGTLIGITTTRPIITSLCFSTAPEGISINVLAAGLSNGFIRYKFIAEVILFHFFMSFFFLSTQFVGHVDFEPGKGHCNRLVAIDRQPRLFQYVAAFAGSKERWLFACLGESS